MKQFFDREFSALKTELRYLKTSAQRSASTISTLTKVVPIKTQLQYSHTPPLNPQARAKKYYEIGLEKNALVYATLDWYYENVAQGATSSTRRIVLEPTILPNGKYGLFVYFIGSEEGDNSDAERLSRGETVEVSVNLTVSCTDNFTITEYII